MSQHAITFQGNHSLRLYLQTEVQTERERLLAELVSTHAEPIVKSILRQRLGVYLDQKAKSDNVDAEDLYGEIRLLIVKRLRESETNQPGNAINDFESYVAMVAHNACHAFLRRKYPQRTSLKNSLQYLLRHHPDFASWQNKEGEWMGGFAVWREEEALAAGARRQRLAELEANPRACLDAKGSDADNQSMNLADSLAAILKWAEGAVELDRLVSILSELRGVRDQPIESLDAAESGFAKDWIDPQQNLALVIENRSSLRQLWVEICLLPPRQRSALLLHLRDGEGRALLNLLPETQVATRRQIAEALELSLEQFLDLRDRLPLDDLSIAALLGATRQQVIKLRDSARRRLARRVKMMPGSKR